MRERTRVGQKKVGKMGMQVRAESGRIRVKKGGGKGVVGPDTGSTGHLL